MVKIMDRQSVNMTVEERIATQCFISPQVTNTGHSDSTELFLAQRAFKTPSTFPIDLFWLDIRATHVQYLWEIILKSRVCIERSERVCSACQLWVTDLLPWEVFFMEYLRRSCISHRSWLYQVTCIYLFFHGFIYFLSIWRQSYIFRLLNK